MAPVRLIDVPGPVERAGLPPDVLMAALLLALGWAFAGYLGVKLLDPKSDLQTLLMVLAMTTLYQVAAFAVAARARRAGVRAK